MARATVTLQGALSHSHGGKKFKKGDSDTVTDPDKIAYYQGTGLFTVTMHKDVEPTKAKSVIDPPPVTEERPAKVKAQAASPTKGNISLSGKTTGGK